MTKILKVRDKFEKYYTEHNFFSLPFKLCICGKSQLSGKTTVILNLLLRDQFYKKHFKGDNIYIVSGNKLDNKIKMLMEQKDIPDENFMDYNEETLTDLYEILEEEFEEARSSGEKPDSKLIVFDDISFSGNLKNREYGIVSRIVCNGRHIMLSSVFTCQKYTQLSTTVRENLTGSIFFGASLKQLDLIVQDHNFLEHNKAFIKMFKANTKEKHDFLVINYSKPFAQRYMDNFFKPIDTDKYT